QREAGGGLGRQGVAEREQHDVLEDIGMVAGVESVAVVHRCRIPARVLSRPGMLRAMPDHASPTPSTVLLVEDDPAIAEAVVYALRAEGFAVEHRMLGTGVAGRVRAGGVDLVLLDVGLPDIGGFEVCRQLRAFSALPVVFLTARGDEVDRVMGLELGADDYIAKPFSPRELVARVRARLRRHPAAGTAGGGAPPRRHGRLAHAPVAHPIRFHGAPPAP